MVIMSVDIKNAFSFSLKYFREQRHISLLELEKATGISNSSLSRYENGLVEPSISNAYIIAKYFGFTIDGFIYSFFRGIL